MNKTILITGSTDGIGLATAKLLVEKGHQVLIHGRSSEKVEKTKSILLALDNKAQIDGFVADLSDLDQVRAMANEVSSNYKHLDGLINNAGVYVVPNSRTKDGLDLRFVVNTIAPYLLTKLLAPCLDESSRVVNLSSAAQSPVSTEALTKAQAMSNDSAYAQSKLALTMWSIHMAKEFADSGKNTLVVAVNPKSFLGSKMVKEAYGTAGHDLRIGADILWRAVLSDEFSNASGKYFDNDMGRFAQPHPDALDDHKRLEVVTSIESVLKKY